MYYLCLLKSSATNNKPTIIITIRPINVFCRLVGSVPNLILIIKRFYLFKQTNLFDIIFRFISRNIYDTYDTPVLYESFGFVIAWRPIQNVQLTIERYYVYMLRKRITPILAFTRREYTLSRFYSDFPNLILSYNITVRKYNKF